MPTTNIPGAIISNAIVLTPDADGLVELPIDELGEGLDVIIDGATLKGIRPVNGGGDYSPASLTTRTRVWIEAAEGSTVSIVHDSGDVDPGYKILTTSGANATIDVKSFAVKYIYDDVAEVWFWRFDDWS